MKQSDAIRAAATIEALKGAVVLLAATGLLSLIHRDLHAAAAKLIEHAHLNPAAKYPRIFLDAANHIQDTRLLLLALGAAAYAIVRLIEAYGLFRERAWAEFLAAGSAALYVPFEVIELFRSFTWYGVVFLGINLIVVWIMVRALQSRRAAGQETS